MENGKCAQVLHIGPYSKEPKSLAKMENLMEEKTYEEWFSLRDLFVRSLSKKDTRREFKNHLKTTSKRKRVKIL